MVMLFAQQRRRRRYLFLFGFVFIIFFITIFIRLALIQPPTSKQYHRHVTMQIKHNNSTIAFPEKRPNVTSRRFISASVELLIEEIKQNINNKELAWLFENCFPNALDTTVDFQFLGETKKRPDTFIITGDVDAMSLRDSSLQIHPYLPLIKDDLKLRQVVEGVLLRQFLCIQHDPYANAHYKNPKRISEWRHLDNTEMDYGIHERKWELDSLCYVLRLMHSYWKEIDYNLTFFYDNEQEVKKSIRLILQTLKDQQRYNGSGKVLLVFSSS
jgi:meiotically up-regulated gene 157 (Mug157) protein